MTIEQDFPLGAQIAILRTPHDPNKPAFKVVGYRGTYLKIRPLNVPDDAVTTADISGVDKPKIMLETFIPAAEAKKF